MQHKVTTPQRLLNEKGNIAEPGYSTHMVWKYDRKDITAKPSRIKEWDYYYISNPSFAIALTIADNGYIGALSASLLEFDNPFQITKSAAVIGPMGKMNMPSTSLNGDISWTQGKNTFTFKNDGKERRLICNYRKFGKKGEELTADIKLSEFPADSMVIATPFDRDGYFYFNQKINCMKAEGTVTLGEKVYRFDGADSLGTLDWGRGVWTYENTWYWGSLQAVLPDKSTFGFNIGYGFGNTSAASENMLFYNGRAHKLDEITFNIPQCNGRDNYMMPWTFTSSDGRLEMDFKPVLDRYAPVNIGVFCMVPHQVFGKFSGRAVLDDGKIIEFKDLMGFAEKVHNKW